jgi:ATP-independent RNA helicase DbpA
VQVTIEEPAVAAPEVEQRLLVTAPERRLHALAWTLVYTQCESALVFCNFKASVLELTDALIDAGISADRFDGDLEQFHRDQVLARFRNQSVRVLVATDVAGRGIDVEGLDLVVNYELPSQPEVYVHRIGRTGRAGKTGVAVSFREGSGRPADRSDRTDARPVAGAAGAAPQRRSGAAGVCWRASPGRRAW